MSLNVLHGISTIWVMDVTTENAYATAVLPAGIIVKKADNKFYLTDGTHTIQRISPIVDQVYTPAEKSIIQAALSGGTYIPAPNGVVVHNNSGKIDDVSLGIINNGKLKEQYLSDFVEAGIIRYAKLPDNVKYSFYTVNTYNDLNSLNSEQRKKLIVVKDASSDPNNDVTGSGLYYYDNGWVSVLSISDKSITATDIANAGAVMYDHRVHLTTNDTNIRAILDDLVIGEVTPDEPDTPTIPDEPDTPIEEEIDSSIQSSYETFINNLNTVVNANSPDLFVAMDRSSMFEYVLRVDVTNVFDTAADISITVTDNTSNLTATLALSRAYDNANIGVAGFNYDDPMYDVTMDRNPNNPVLITVTDGTKTATLLYSSTNNYYFYNIIEVSTANGWSISN